MKSQTLLTELGRPFAPAHISWLPGATNKDNTKCMAMAYADSRAYQDRLDAVLGLDWSVRYTQAGQKSVVCELTITVDGRTITRSATGDDTDLMSAEARSFKRACSAFNLGRYLYELPPVWVAYDAKAKRIDADARAKLDARYKAWYQRNISTKVENATPEGTIVPTPQENVQTAQIAQPDDKASDNHNGLPEPWHEDWTTPADYTAAMEWGRKSGKFNHERHLIAGWAKVFAANEAHKPENAKRFLDAFYVYVMEHEPAHSNGKVPA